VNTQINKGKAIEIITAVALNSGQPVLVGSLVGISANRYNIGDTAVIWLLGTHQISKAAEAWTPGSKLYWDNTNNDFTQTQGANTFAGYAAAAALQTDPTGLILLRQ
jgi:predicted RecA/RadA family phage recombinase